MAINQPPLPITRLGAAARPAAWRSRALPPGHLLRQVCGTAPDYAAALRLLRKTPIAAVAGHALRPAAPVVAVANHWDGLAHPGAPRWLESHARQQRMTAVLTAGPVPPGFAWLAPSLANPGTHLTAVMRPTTGTLELIAMNGERRVSTVLTIDRPLA
ncbi:hypothetical protein E2C06_23920 [Dankookia rubra]|uniref:Uncharacterized protein n=1 Tax=Dankookia rubra TaxID=1442381 RepID=A0A4R5QB92_9PROT|nr:hypothetical protein [Dankookia rubra]TDH60096.1 hypothetical protein E2C06_23920 [Dankookia rubra]